MNTITITVNNEVELKETFNRVANELGNNFCSATSWIGQDMAYCFSAKCIDTGGLGYHPQDEIMIRIKE